jgi:hypothetical protein
MSNNNVMPLSDGMESEGVYWQTYEIGQGERRLDLLLGDETMLPPDDISPSNIIEILVANHQAKHTHTNKAVLDGITAAKIAEWDNMGDHTHDEYVTQSDLGSYATQADLDLLEDVVDTKASSTHSHSEYASTSHSHADYATQIALDTLAEEVDGKVDASHTHANYALTTHNHDSDYASSTHTHTASEVGAATSGHNHNDDYAAIDHVHTNYATTTALNEVSAAVSNKANASHTHNDIYYTETEIDTKLAGKADSSHTHNGVYDTSGAAENALTSAKAYTDTAIANLLDNSTTAVDSIYELRDAMEDNADAIEALETIAASKASASDLTSHAENTTIHITSVERNTWNAKSNFSGSYNDLTNKPTIPSVDGLATETYVDSAVSTKANASHTHTIANITNLQSTLDGKAATSHGTHVSYSTTAPVMDGTASVGTASTVARSDHKHPTDTSRAAQTSLDAHTSNKSNPHGVTLAQLGITATAAELNALDGITATVTELNYMDGVTSNVQTQLNAKAASSHTHSYAGSSSAGGAATSANKLNTNAGSATQPVYFANGVPVKTTYTLGASVPSGAKFTDTTYGAVTTSANGLMIASDKAKLDSMVLATVSEVETYLAI